MTKRMSFDFSDEEIIVDLFAGGGGASTGIEMALGRSPDVAINHDPEAIALHKVNHPDTIHFINDVFELNPANIAIGRPVGLLWLSPDCKHFSKAKGGKPKSKKVRSLAWVGVKWAKKKRPRVIILENVEEFQEWGPLKCDGKACELRKGNTFRKFVSELERLGYNVEWKEHRASDYGTPTIRKRLFLIARCDGEPIIWPDPTHGNPKSEAVISGALKPWKTAAECIDWSLVAPSIFESEKEIKEKYGLRVRRPLKENTLNRIAKGLKKFVLENDEPYIVTANHSGENFRGQSVLEPMKTITAANDAHGLVLPFVQTYYGPKSDGTGFERGNNMNAPVGTITAGGGRHSLVVPFLTEHANASAQRIFNAAEPMRTQMAEVKGGHFALVQAFMAQHNLGNIGRKVNAPFSTITTTGSQQQLVTAHCQRDFGQSVGHKADNPCGAITSGGGGKEALVLSSMIKMRGGNIGSKTDEPVHTITSGGTHIGEVRAFLAKYYGTGEGQSINESMHTVTTKDRFGLVTVHGELHQIIDIGMRMLTPRELFRAQGFPEHYKIDIEFNGKPLTKKAQVRMCGNSVCPPLAAALIKANFKIRTKAKVSA